MPSKSGLPGLHPLSLLLIAAGVIIIALGVYNYLTGGRAGTPIGIGFAGIFLGLYLNRSVRGRTGNDR